MGYVLFLLLLLWTRLHVYEAETLVRRWVDWAGQDTHGREGKRERRKSKRANRRDCV